MPPGWTPLCRTGSCCARRL